MAKKPDVEIEALKVQQKQLDLQIENKKMVKEILDKGLPMLEKYLNKKLEVLEGPKTKWTIAGFLIILGIIVIMSGGLVYVGKLDSGSFTFLLGTLIGGSITFLGDIILPES